MEMLEPFCSTNNPNSGSGPSPMFRADWHKKLQQGRNLNLILLMFLGNYFALTIRFNLRSILYLLFPYMYILFHFPPKILGKRGSIYSGKKNNKSSFFFVFTDDIHYISNIIYISSRYAKGYLGLGMYVSIIY